MLDHLREYWPIYLLTIWVLYMFYSDYKDQKGYFLKKNRDSTFIAATTFSNSFLKSIHDLETLSTVSQSNISLVLVDPSTGKEVVFSPNDLTQFRVEMKGSYSAEPISS